MIVAGGEKGLTAGQRIVKVAMVHGCDGQLAGFPVFIGGLVRVQGLLAAGQYQLPLGQTILIRAQGPLTPAVGRLAEGFLGDRVHEPIPAFALDQLIDHVVGHMAGAGDQTGAHPIRIDGGCGQSGDGVLVQVVGHGDGGLGGPQGVQLVTGPLSQGSQVAGVDPDAAQIGAGDFHGGLDGVVDVVSIGQKGGADSQGADLGLEGVAFAVMNQGEGVSGSADAFDPVLLGRGQVGCGGETTDHGGPGGSHGGVLADAAAAHIGARAVSGGRGDAGGGGGDRAVVIQDAQNQGLQQNRLTESTFHLEDRRIGEEDLTFPVGLDAAGEAVVLQVPDGLVGNDVVVFHVSQIAFGRAEILQVIKDAAQTGDHPITAAGWQMAGEDLEDAFAAGRPVFERGVQHGVFVHVGQHGRAEIMSHHWPPIPEASPFSSKPLRSP